MRTKLRCKPLLLTEINNKKIYKLHKSRFRCVNVNNKKWTIFIALNFQISLLKNGTTDFFFVLSYLKAYFVYF